MSATGPGRGAAPRHPFLDHPGPVAFAHRGGSGEAPENTFAAFSRAVSLGYRYLETDVHASADGVLVVCHDATLDRVAGRPGAISELAWRALREVRVAGSEPLPRLDEVLEEWPHARFNIDAKADRAVEPLARLVERSGAIDRVCLTSFSGPRLARLRSLLGPALCTAASPGQVSALRGASLLPAAARGRWARAWSGVAAVQVPERWRGVPVVDRRLLAAAHGAGLAVHVWTIDEPPAMERLLDLGVDGIMTDHPSRLRRVLCQRGQWPPEPGPAATEAAQG